MNSIKHHLSDATISEYASGTLPEAIEVVVACHLTFCPHCRERSHAADRIGGYFLDSAEPAAPRLDALEVLRNMGSDVPDSANNPGIEEERAPALQGIPMPLARRLPADLDNLNWKFLAKGVQQFDLSNSVRGRSMKTADQSSSLQPETRARLFGQPKSGAFKLLKLQPGTELVEHSHGDHEMTLVLQGAYSDKLGYFGVGDVADLGPDHSHKPHIETDEPCIALIASNSPAKYRGLLGRVMQPFVGI